MTTYRISGCVADLGLYEGETPRDAAEALARDAGYESLADSANRLGQTEQEWLAELTIVEVEG